MTESVQMAMPWGEYTVVLGALLGVLLVTGECAWGGNSVCDASAQHGEVNVPLIVAHRGASRAAPENTLPAFRLAWKQGADAIEGDFRQTEDGHIVCIHDADTKRVADKALVVGESSLAELRDLDVGSHKGQKYKGAVIPTLSEVLAAVPAHKKIYIEIKGDESMVPGVLDNIRESDLTEEQIFLISFNENVIRACKSRAPQYGAAWLSGFKKDDDGKIRPTSETVLETLKDINADGFSSSKNRVRRSLVDKVKESGYGYHVWTVDDPGIARRFKEWGARSITTNVPGTIREALFGQDGPVGSR